MPNIKIAKGRIVRCTLATGAGEFIRFSIDETGVKPLNAKDGAQLLKLLATPKVKASQTIAELRAENAQLKTAQAKRSH